MDNPFSSLIGHDKIKEFLINSLSKGKISHAYIFCGSENVGKTKTAECFAAALLNIAISHPEFISGSVLTSSQMPKQVWHDNNESDDFQFLKNNPDFILIEREINEKTRLRSDEIGTKEGQHITINQIRELNNKIQSTSFLGGRKVIVIKEADLMTLEAANAFLKNLEEPKGNTVIILLANNPKKLPETIVSRCQVIYFHPVPLSIIREYLIKFGTDPQKAELIVSLSGSRPGLALRLLKDKELLQFYKRQTDLFSELFNLPLSERWGKIKEAIKEEDISLEKTKFYTILNIWIIAARRRMRESLNVDAVEKIYSAMLQARANVNPKLIIENLMVNL